MLDLRTYILIHKLESEIGRELIESSVDYLTSNPAPSNTPHPAWSHLIILPKTIQPTVEQVFKNEFMGEHNRGSAAMVKHHDKMPFIKERLYFVL